MNTKYKFDRQKIVAFFASHSANILFFFHEKQLTPTQMTGFWKTVPNASRMLALKQIMEQVGKCKVDIFEYIKKVE